MCYNELASAAIDQEGTMGACEVAKERKRKRTMLGSSEAVLVVLPRSTAWSTHHPRDSRADLRSYGAIVHSLSSSSTSSTALHLHHSNSRWQLGHHNSLHRRILMLQLREVRSLCKRLPTTQGNQHTASSDNRGEPAQGSVEGLISTVWPCQLHQCGGDAHEGGSTCSYVPPQRVSYDEDITLSDTHNPPPLVIQGPITRAHAR
jgi:hypothetical protein